MNRDCTLLLCTATHQCCPRHIECIDACRASQPQRNSPFGQLLQLRAFAGMVCNCGSLQLAFLAPPEPLCSDLALHTGLPPHTVMTMPSLSPTMTHVRQHADCSNGTKPLGM